MAKTKEKEKEQANKKKVSPFLEELIKEPEVMEPNLVREQQTKLWGKAVENLLTKEFANMDDAVQAVIDQVITKVVVPGVEEDKVRDFLQTFLETDPVIMEDLKRSLKIK